jgi:hypothetical protein
MTDKLRQAAEMALEALESEIEFPKTGPALTMMKDSVEALRQALAEPDTGTDRGAWSDVPDATKWVDELRGDEPDLLNQTCCECGKSGGYALYCVDCWNKASQWQGLTDEQIIETNFAHRFVNNGYSIVTKHDLIQFAKEIENKLRENHAG